MKTLLEAIQQYPDQFISTLQARANTTHSETNKANHKMLSIFIKSESWHKVEDMIQQPVYLKPFNGVIYCLDRYSEIDNKAWHQIVDLFEQEKFV